MGEILILESIVREVTSSLDVPFVLFGRPDYVQLAKRDHDFFFHSLQRVSARNFDGFLTIPVLPYREDNQYTEQIFEMYKANDNLKTFAARDKSPRKQVALGKEEVLTGTFLKFFDVLPHPLGASIEPRQNYFTSKEDDFKFHFENVGRIFQEWEHWREEINAEYR